MRALACATFALLAVACVGGGGDENCHMKEHVGAFGGDADGEIVLVGERVNDDNLVQVELLSDDDAFFADGTLRVEEALEGGCSDWSFAGEIVDDAGATGTLEGVITTTSGDGTWSFEDGRSGTWTWGSR